MLKAEEIKKIELGPRQQLLFDLEDRTLSAQKKILARMTDWVEVHGEVQALAFSQSTAEAFGMPAVAVLQHLFWLAHDLKIQFSDAGRPLSPDQALSRLSRSSGAPVELTLYPSVEAAVFSRVHAWLRRMGANEAQQVPRNAVDLARCLTRKIRTWKGQLEVCRTRARRPGFPGKAEIKSALAFVRTLTAKRDAESLILAFDAHADALARLDADVKALAIFYREHEGQWRVLLRFARQARQTLDRFDEDADIAAAYERFRQIMSHPRPYPHVAEASRLQKTLKPCHERIEARRTQQRRAEACMQLKTLIQTMKAHLDTHAADPDTRNRSLYLLRRHLKAVETAPTLRGIDHRRRAAEEDYEQLLEAMGGG